MFKKIPEQFKILWNSIKPSKIFQNLQKHYGIFKNPLEQYKPSKIFHLFQEDSKLFQKVLEDYSTF